jgi:hypothetical protein
MTDNVTGDFICLPFFYGKGQVDEIHLICAALRSVLLGEIPRNDMRNKV